MPKDQQTLDKLFDHTKNTIVAIVSVVMGFLLSLVPSLIQSNSKQSQEKYNKYYAYDLILEYLSDNKDPIIEKLIAITERDRSLFKYSMYNTILVHYLKKLSFKNKIETIKLLKNHCDQITDVVYTSHQSHCRRCSTKLPDIQLANKGYYMTRIVYCSNCKAGYRASITKNGRFRLKLTWKHEKFIIGPPNWRRDFRDYLEVYCDGNLEPGELKLIASAIVSEFSENSNISLKELTSNLSKSALLAGYLRDINLANSFIRFVTPMKIFTEHDGSVYKLKPSMISEPNIACGYITAIIDALMNKNLRLNATDVEYIFRTMLNNDINYTQSDINFVCAQRNIRTQPSMQSC